MANMFDPLQVAGQFAKRDIAPRFRLGKVSSINNNRTINVTVAGSTTVISSVKYLASVQPVPDLPVWLVSDGLDVFAFGVIAQADASFNPRTSRSTDQSIADSNDTAITFDAVNSDPWGSWSAGSATRITAKITGRYMAVGQVQFASNATGLRQVWIERTSTLAVGRSSTLSVGGGTPTHVSVTSQVIDMVADTDYIRLMVRQNSGGALAVTSSSTFSPSLSLIYLGP